MERITQKGVMNLSLSNKVVTYIHLWLKMTTFSEQQSDCWILLLRFGTTTSCAGRRQSLMGSSSFESLQIRFGDPTLFSITSKMLSFLISQQFHWNNISAVIFMTLTAFSGQEYNYCHSILSFWVLLCFIINKCNIFLTGFCFSLGVNALTNHSDASEFALVCVEKVSRLQCLPAFGLLSFQSFICSAWPVWCSWVTMGTYM